MNTEIKNHKEATIKLFTNLRKSFWIEIKIELYKYKNHIINEQELSQRVVIVTRNNDKKWKDICRENVNLALNETGFLSLIKLELNQLFAEMPLVISSLKYL